MRPSGRGIAWLASGSVVGPEHETRRIEMFKEFKDFAMRGNVLDMAIGIIIGAAFGKIISAMVNGVLMPPIGLMLGGVDFTEMFINLSGGYYPTLAAAQEAGAVVVTPS
jgi:large conductance mechanosensitive channel